MLNSILLEGTIVNLAEENLDNGIHICRFSIITNKWISQEDETDDKTVCFPVKSMGNLAQICMKSFKAGTQVRVIGHLALENTITVVAAEHIELLPIIKVNEVKA